MPVAPCSRRIPMKRSEEVANAVLLASNESQYLLGSEQVVDGGIASL